jgi:hypothetical protein
LKVEAVVEEIIALAYKYKHLRFSMSMWQMAARWLFLGKKENSSNFLKFPDEVIFNFVGVLLRMAFPKDQLPPKLVFMDLN